MPLTAPLPTVTPPAFVADLSRHGDRVALATADGALTYRELDDRVTAAAAVLGAGRRLVMICAAPHVDVVVHYLAALRSGHPVLLVPDAGPTQADLVRRYDPDVVVSLVADRCVVAERRPGTTHHLHPDLALLLSTSGSTGSPRLVRLSAANLQANAEAIAASLQIRPEDRAPTTLPLHYCYGLSLVHSHLLRGAGLILTDLSVVDRCFWELFRRERGTTLAGVPYTFDLLDRIGFAEMDLPHLRSVTQAGGRMDPAVVRRYAELGLRRGWDLVVMYGQTEATARMAYLPPHLALDHPGTVGLAVPGGSFHIDPVPECDRPGVGELVYTGPNVMMGYADAPADLALGATVESLRTGDLARWTADGLVQVVGRRSRFLKVLGQRIDLDRVEALLAEQDLQALCSGQDGLLAVAVAGADVHTGVVRSWLAETLRVPAAAVVVSAVAALPRLANGKPDHAAVRALAAAASPPSRRPEADGARPASARRTASRGPVTGAMLRDLLAEVLDRPDATVEDSFVGLGGDSLSYVEMSVRLEELLGHLPADWHTRPVRALVPPSPPRPDRPRRERAMAALDLSVAVRAVAILLIVGSHANVLSVLGGAHLLLGVAGYNFARFQLTTTDRVQRLRQVLTSMVRVVVPSVLWIGAATAVSRTYDLSTVLLLTNVLGPDRWGVQWHYWFLEAVLYIVLAVALLLTVPAVDRWERRAPFALAVALLTVGLLLRFEVVQIGTGPRIQSPHMVFWLFALGWAAAKTSGTAQRLVVTALVLAAVPGFFHDPAREAVIAVGLCLVTWVRTVRCPRVLVPVAGALAGSSLYVYVTHWSIYPHLEDDYPLLALAASLVVGMAYWRLSEAVASRVAGRLGGTLAGGLRTWGAHPGRTPVPRRGGGAQHHGADSADRHGTDMQIRTN